MTITDFLRHIKQPETIADENITIVRDLADRFPYCAASQVLLAYRLFRDNDLDFPTQLKKVAAYSSSRKKLKQLLENLQLMEDKSAQPDEIIVPADQATGNDETPVFTEETVTESPDEIFEYPLIAENEYHIPEIVDQEMSREDELLSIVRRRLKEIKQEREKEGISEGPATPAGSETGKKELTRSELVDRFLHDKPRLSSPKAAFFSPTEKAIKSSQDDDEIVTETLARLYFKQGNISKAVRIYDKLILLFPEKSSYFAAQIEKMTSNL